MRYTLDLPEGDMDARSRQVLPMWPGTCTARKGQCAFQRAACLDCPLEAMPSLEGHPRQPSQHMGVQ